MSVYVINVNFFLKFEKRIGPERVNKGINKNLSTKHYIFFTSVYECFDYYFELP